MKKFIIKDINDLKYICTECENIIGGYEIIDGERIVYENKCICNKKEYIV